MSKVKLAQIAAANNVLTFPVPARARGLAKAARSEAWRHGYDVGFRAGEKAARVAKRAKPGRGQR